MVLLDLDGAAPVLIGAVTRRLLEIRPNCFVGSASRKSIDQMWNAVLAANPKAALLVYPAKNELGIAFRSHGQHRYSVEDNFGITLITYRRVAGGSG